MSELQLSHELIRTVQDAVAAQDPQAQDAGVAAQYLAAIIGVLLGGQDMPKASKNEILEHLTGFMKHVMEDVEGQRQQSAPPAGDGALGIWRPGDK